MPYGAKWYRQTVVASGFSHVLDFESIDARGQLLYLVFGTTHQRGLEKMKEVMWEVDEPLVSATETHVTQVNRHLRSNLNLRLHLFVDRSLPTSRLSRTSDAQLVISGCSPCSTLSIKPPKSSGADADARRGRDQQRHAFLSEARERSVANARSRVWMSLTAGPALELALAQGDTSLIPKVYYSE